jgi:cytoplasmic FMR1 interacting protein
VVTVESKFRVISAANRFLHLLRLATAKMAEEQLVNTEGKLVNTLKIVEKLEAFQKTLIDGPPNLEVPSTAMNYDIASMAVTNFKDRDAFETTSFIEETMALEELDQVFNDGKQYISFLYTYRSCGGALPQVPQGATEDVAAEIHQKIYDILHPQILVLDEFYAYQIEAINATASNIQMLVKSEQAKAVQPEAIVTMLIKCINIMVILDSLKDRLSHLKNDMSRYRRSCQKVETNDAQNATISKLCNFLNGGTYGPTSFIIKSLKDAVQKLQGHDIVINLLLNHCADAIGEKWYLLPEEQHMYYRVIPYLIFILDGEGPDSHKTTNAFKTGKIKLKRLQKLYKKGFHIIPIYGDLSTEVHRVLEMCANWEPFMIHEWMTSNVTKLKVRYDLRYSRVKIRSEYTDVCARVAALLNEIKSFEEQGKDLTPTIMVQCITSSLDAFKKMSEWSARIIEQSAWKYINPISEEEYKSRLGEGEPPKGADYDKSVRLNYSNEEMHALVDVIGIIKGLSALMMKCEDTFVPLLRRFIHDEFQEFLQAEVARPLRKAHKRKAKIKNTMIQMRDIGGDWMDKAKQKEDYKQNKKVLVTMNRNFPRRTTAPTVTQITLIRRMVWAICSPNAAGLKGGIFSTKDLKTEWVELWRKFYHRSFFYEYLLDYHQTVRKLADMSHLWFREFYLGLTRCIQFPIDMSMPWIMTNFLINTPSMKENVFFPFDVYNDAGSRALVDLKQQYLYDEVEAELNLSFLQLIFHMSEDVFRFYKTVASSVLIDKDYQRNYRQVKDKENSAQLINSRYVAVMSQRHVNLLGRTVDINALLSEHVTEKLRGNITDVIKKFESQPLSSIIEFKALLDNVRLTHELVSEHLNIDPFQSLLAEENANTYIGRFQGRIFSHVFSEMVEDILKNYIWNSTTRRFVESPILASKTYRKKGAGNGAPDMWYGRGYKDAFDKQGQIYRSYFGEEHIQALFDVLDITDIPLLYNELTSTVENILQYELSAYIEQLFPAMPSIPVPPLQRGFGVIGAFCKFDMKLATGIANYELLRTDVFQKMREIGNGIILLQFMDNVLAKRSNYSWQKHAFFQNVALEPPPTGVNEIPPPKDEPFLFPATDQKQNKVYCAVVKCLNELSANPNQDRGVLEKLNACLENALKLHCLTSSSTKTMFGLAMGRIQQAVLAFKASWQGKAPTTDECMDMDNPKTFTRLFSILQYLFCQENKPEPGEDADAVDDFAMFGEGWYWAAHEGPYLLDISQ